eukprot:Lithocolla_globosa_v1_NODE_7100_length_992_cov_33.225187.p1 type:complete len:306 gc:universal NODE_7100_length_992_cov_33.225187:934-17(-)
MPPKRNIVGAKRKKVITYNILVVGRSGLGKTTTVNTLLETGLLPAREPTATGQTPDIVTLTEEMQLDVGNATVTVIDTPGFGDAIDSRKSHEKILVYVDEQFHRFLEAESRIHRDTKFLDTRVHVCLYFISPHCGLKEIDIDLIKKLGRRVDILPVLAKSDTLNPTELKNVKKQVKAQIAKHKLATYNFPHEDDDDEEVIQECELLRGAVPFSVIGGVADTESGSYVRTYPWGKVDVYDGTSCDMETLRSVVLGSHMEIFKDSCNDIHYETYREDRLQVQGVIDASKIEEELQAKEKEMKKQKPE